MTTQPLADPAAVSDLENGRQSGLKREGHPRYRLVLWGLVITFIGAATGILGKKLMADEIVTVVGALVSLAGMFLAAYPYLSPSLANKHESSSPSRPEGLTHSEPSKYLAQGGNIEHLPSVTERTTDLLKKPSAVRSRQKEQPNKSGESEQP